MADAVIAERPPRDGREWDAQCARCGSSVLHHECGFCGGEGWIEDEDDPDVALRRCDDCRGAGQWLDCGSDADYCEAHPAPGREGQPRGGVEWFVVGAPRGATEEASDG